MLILTGTLGLVQALFLPGFVAARALGVRGRARTLTASVALSLLLNFALVSLLVDLGAYRRETLFALFAVECALAVLLLRRRGPAPARAPATALSLGGAIAAIAVAALGAWYASRAVRAASGIFSGEDDVASWNRWAMDWFRGGFPEHTWNYPQIVPVAWSLTYAFMGTDLVQSFARGMMPLFGLVAMLAVGSAGGAPARPAALASAWFTGIFLARVNNVTAGLADLPVACFTAMALAECVREPEPEASEPRPWASLFAAGAALTKQAGLFLVAVVPALEAWKQPPGKRRRAVLQNYALALAVTAPWYLLKQGEIAAGRETSEVAHVLTGAHGGTALFDRPAHAFARLAEIAGGWPVLVAIVVLGMLGLRDRAVRPLLLAVAIPFTLLWSFAFSYDPRNLSVALVAWGFGCGAGAAVLLRLARLPNPEFAWRPGASLGRAGIAVGALIGVALAVAARLVPDARLLEHQRRLQRGLGDPEVSGALADLRAAGSLGGSIATEASYLLAHAPGWEGRFAIVRAGDDSAWAAALERPGVDRALRPAGAAPIDRDGWEIERRFTRATLWRRAR